MRASRRRSTTAADFEPNPFATWPDLRLLHEAHLQARGPKRDPWESALEIDDLIAAGVPRTALRRLLRMGLAEHAVETTRPGAARRSFRRARSLALPRRTCFVLTPAGVEAARQAEAADRPSWDGVSRLCWGETVLKEFRRAASMQKRILDEFERQGWPRRIDNPLPRLSAVNRKQHLRETIKNLNRGLTRKLISFHADGTGLGVYWSPGRNG